MADDNQSGSSGGMPIGVTIGIIAVVLTGVGVGGYFMWNYFKSPAIPGGMDTGKSVSGDTSKKTASGGGGGAGASTGTVTQGGGGAGGGAGVGTILQMGSNGNDVKTLQTKLNAKGAGLTVDGDFGALTQAALKKYYNGKTSITTTELAGWNNEFGGDYNTVVIVKEIPGSTFGGVKIY